MRPSPPILVLGNGGFGTALALVLHRAGHSVVVLGHRNEVTAEIERTRENRRYLPGIRIPDTIRFRTELDEDSARATTIVSVAPTQHLRETWMRIEPTLSRHAAGTTPEGKHVREVASPLGGRLIISCSKGFERGSGELPSACIRDVVPESRLCVLSGPSHAEEIARHLITSVVVAARDDADAREAQAVFGTTTFRVYRSSDPIGVEVGGAAKNVIALAAGISDGLGFGDNARAALVCRGALEISRLGTALGARAATFTGLSGIGDLVATCTSAHSRNRAVGIRIAQGEKLRDILATTETIAEGVTTTASVTELSSRLGVDLPITRAVYGILYEDQSPRHAVERLMSRAAGDELGAD
jgi:glycerol-3-phosphate dehydrogenase (NAD(P)+)